MVTWRREGGGGWWLLVVVLSSVLMWYEYELRSLNFQTKMKTKMSQKMIIFVKVRVGFDFLKLIIFRFIFISF